MPDAIAFLLWIALVAVSSLVLEGQIERLGASWRLTEASQGLVTALAADAPEISSAIAAIASGNRDLGIGVVLGSNVFNVTVLFGLSALVANGIRVRPRGFALGAGVAVIVTILTTALVMRFVGPVVSTIFLAAVLVPYVYIVSLRPAQIDRLPVDSRMRRLVQAVTAEVAKDERTGATARPATLIDGLSMIPSLAAVVIGSIHMVALAVPLASRLGIPHVVVGSVILAGLTGIPNTIAAVRLATRGRGAAVASEGLNSNTINVVVGICLPGLILGTRRPSAPTATAAYVLLGLTVLTLGGMVARKGVSRAGGGTLLTLYVAFLIVMISSH